MVCPACGGGQNKRATFGLGREVGRVWWKCLRASCGITGISESRGLPAPAERKTTLARINPYWGALYPLADEDYAYFADRFELEPWEIENEIQVTEYDEYAIKIRDPQHMTRGHVVRQPVWKGLPVPVRWGVAHRPKTQTFLSSTDPARLAWYRPASTIQQRSTPQIVIVEDQISAMKCAACGFIAAALLGTYLNMGAVREIAQRRKDIVTLVLDPDAQDNAHEQRRRWGGYWNRCRIVSLEQDPKDIALDTLREELAL